MRFPAGKASHSLFLSSPDCRQKNFVSGVHRHLSCSEEIILAPQAVRSRSDAALDSLHHDSSPDTQQEAARNPRGSRVSFGMRNRGLGEASAFPESPRFSSRRPVFSFFLCDVYRMEFRAVWSAPAVNRFPPEALVSVELFPTQGSQLTASRRHGVSFIFFKTEPSRLENLVVQIQLHRGSISASGFFESAISGPIGAWWFEPTTLTPYQDFRGPRANVTRVHCPESPARFGSSRRRSPLLPPLPCGRRTLCPVRSGRCFRWF